MNDLPKTPNQILFQAGKRIILMLAEKNVLTFTATVVSYQRGKVELSLEGKSPEQAAFAPGTQVRLSGPQDASLVFAQGEILNSQTPRLVVNCPDAGEREQQRNFVRVPLEDAIKIRRVVLPDGTELSPMGGFLTDVSAGGIGVLTETALPKLGVVEIPGLLGKWLPALAERHYCLKILWCQPFPPFGYRSGAGFIFLRVREQEEMLRLMSELQAAKLAEVNARLGAPPSAD